MSVSGGTGVLTGRGGQRRSSPTWASPRGTSRCRPTSRWTSCPTGGGTWVNLAGRNVGGNQYNAQLWFGSDGTVWESLLSELNGTETDLGDYQLPVTYKAGTALSVRLQAGGSGTTTLQAQGLDGGHAPSRARGSCRRRTRRPRCSGPAVWSCSSTSRGRPRRAQTLRVDNVWAGAAGTTPGGTPTPPPANAAPTASFTATVTAATVARGRLGVERHRRHRGLLRVGLR